MAIVVGIDAQPKRLGVGLVYAEDGAPMMCRTYPLDANGRGWPWHQVAAALRMIEVDALEEV